MVSKNTKTEATTAAKNVVAKKTEESVPASTPVVAAAEIEKKTKKSAKKETEVAKVEPEVKLAGGAKKNKAKTVEPVANTEKVVKDKKNVKEVKIAESATAVKKNTKKVAEKKLVEKKVNKAKAKIEVKQETEDVDEAGDQLNSKLRYFKLIYNDQVQGRYCGRKPKQAANKAFSSIIKDYKKSGQQNGGVNVDINFTIKECTRNSKHKEYKYIGKREILVTPVKVEIANEDGSIKQIEYKFQNKLQKARKDV
jgi:hypothetical protein